MREQTILIDSPAKRDRAAAWLAKVPCDEVMQLTIAPYKQTRSQRANRRYWLVIGLIASHTGHDKDEIHELMKNKFLGTIERNLNGETLTGIRSSAKLKVKEFAEYSERVEQWAVEHLGVWLE